MAAAASMRAENLRIRTPEGTLRAAVAADYTHIRWQLKKNLKGHAVALCAFARS